MTNELLRLTITRSETELLTYVDCKATPYAESAVKLSLSVLSIICETLSLWSLLSIEVSAKQLILFVDSSNCSIDEEQLDKGRSIFIEFMEDSGKTGGILVGIVE